MPVTIKELPEEMQFRVKICKKELEVRECIEGIVVGYQDTKELTSKTIIEIRLQNGKLIHVPIEMCCDPDKIDVLAAITIGSGR